MTGFRSAAAPGRRPAPPPRSTRTGVLVGDVGEVLAARVSRVPRCAGEVRARVFGESARCRRCGWRWEGEHELLRLGAQLGDAMLHLPALARYLGVDGLATLRSWAHRDGWDRVKVGRRTMYRLADARDAWCAPSPGGRARLGSCSAPQSPAPGMTTVPAAVLVDRLDERVWGQRPMVPTSDAGSPLGDGGRLIVRVPPGRPQDVAGHRARPLKSAHRHRREDDDRGAHNLTVGTGCRAPAVGVAGQCWVWRVAGVGGVVLSSSALTATREQGI